MQTRRVIVVTGVSRGLGRAMAAKFAELGHTVVGCARSANEVQNLQKQFGQPHNFSAVDVTNDAQVQAWANTVITRHTVPDLLVNNAAVINRNAPLWQVGDDEFSEVINVNVRGVANVIRHFVPAMIKRKSGIIVNFSSGWGRSTDAEVAPYCASKWAIEGLTQALAQELPKGMAAVPLNPGVINTEMLRSCFGGSASSYPSAEEWAETAVPFMLGITAKDNGKPLTAP